MRIERIDYILLSSENREMELSTGADTFRYSWELAIQE